MQQLKTRTRDRVAAFIDLGTNSVRLLIVRFEPNHTCTVLTRQKEAVRLGDGEFPTRMLQPQAMQRAILVCRRFREMVDSFGAQEVIAVATSASREAGNRRVFLRRLKEEAELDMRVVSGKEEARLIYLGLSGGLKLGKRLACFLDIGGGSTEVIVGDQHQHRLLETLKLGAIRLTNRFRPSNEEGRVSRRLYEKICEYVGNSAVRTLEHVRALPFEVAVGSSGTIVTLGEVAARRLHGRPLAKEDCLTRECLAEIMEELCALPLQERCRVPGLNPRRADIIIAGGAILETFMRQLKIKELRISERGLQDGLLADYQAQLERSSPLQHLPVRERSVLQLGRACRFDEGHAHHVSQLAGQLFDSARSAGLHGYGPWERELLEYAAWLHDIGVFLSFTRHERHAHYIIRHADLLGFDQTELDIVAALALYHRKPSPKKSHPQFAELDARSQEIVSRLSILLRIAEGLDRSHAGLVSHARLRAADRESVVLELSARGDCPLEVWGIQNHQKAFKRAFDRSLLIEVHQERRGAGTRKRRQAAAEKAARRPKRSRPGARAR